MENAQSDVFKLLVWAVEDSGCSRGRGEENKKGHHMYGGGASACRKSNLNIFILKRWVVEGEAP